MIREINLNDTEQYNYLGSFLHNNFNKLFNLANTLKYSANKIYVYVEKNKVVGFIHASISFDVMDIINIVVLPEYRHQHIASSLIDFVINKYSIKEILIEVKTDNPAVSFYQREDFTIVKTLKNYYSPGDGYLMKRVIK